MVYIMQFGYSTPIISFLLSTYLLKINLILEKLFVSECLQINHCILR